MATVFDHSTLPLWLFIVIICVGALVIIGTVLGIWRWTVYRKKNKRLSGAALPSPGLPTRKVTVRRGRVIPASHYLSLTGSVFGLGAFMNMDEKRSSRGGRRSPFGIWASSQYERSETESRQSRLSSLMVFGHARKGTNETTSEMLAKPEPAFTFGHLPRESASSGVSLPSILGARELAEDAMTRLAPEKLQESPSPESKPGYTNFSRSMPHRSPLAKQYQASIMTNPHLSRISEHSGRASTVSHKSYNPDGIRTSALPPPAIPALDEERPSTMQSQHSQQSKSSSALGQDLEPPGFPTRDAVRDSSHTLDSESEAALGFSWPAVPPTRDSQASFDRRHPVQVMGNVDSSYAWMPPSRLYVGAGEGSHSAPDLTRGPLKPPLESTVSHNSGPAAHTLVRQPSQPASPASPTSPYPSFDESLSGVTSSLGYRQPQDNRLSRNQASPPPIAELPSLPKRMSVIAPNTSSMSDATVVRAPSRKGNVLRKKSIKKAEVTSKLG